jgi:hypothetical protein
MEDNLMALKKRNSITLDQADMRSNSIKAIKADLDLGNGLTVARFEQLIADGRAKLDQYNQTLALADKQANEVEAAETEARNYSKRMLSAVEAVYGPDSSEYEQAGGTRASERKKAARKVPPKS